MFPGREKVSIKFRSLVSVCYRRVADLLFDPALFAGEVNIQPDVILSAAWFLHYPWRSGLMNFYRAGTYWGPASLLRLQCSRL
jgi:hypothetical protein